MKLYVIGAKTGADMIVFSDVVYSECGLLPWAGESTSSCKLSFWFGCGYQKSDDFHFS